MNAKKASSAPVSAKEKPVQAAGGPQPLSGAGKATRMAGFVQRFFRDDESSGDGVIQNEAAAQGRCRALQKRIILQGYVILCLLVAVILLIPVLQPIYKYQAQDDVLNRRDLIPLTMPNLTDQAILSWSATSITEILTFGFGDFDQRMLSHRPLFTDQGWESFTAAIRDQDMRSTFKLRQLVLTSVPANLPVIVGKGEDKENFYQWLVEMPVVMTYTTNNNVTSRQKGIVRLTIVRVHPSINVRGIAIKSWMLL